MPSTSTARQNTAPRAVLGFGSQNTKPSGKDTIEGRSGSGQLVDSSVSDDYSAFRSGFIKRDEATRLGGPLPKPNDAPFAQHRSNSNSGLPQAYAGAARTSSSFSASRPATSGISSTTSTAPKTQYSGTFDSPLSYTNEPPAVFTKFDRPNKPTSSRPIDSAYGEWVDSAVTQSPVDERRRPSATGYFQGLPSAPPSRNNSLPPSRHSDIQPTYPNSIKSDAFSASQAPANSFRVGSFSSTSRPNGSFGAADAQTNPLSQFSQMNVHDDSQSLASQRPSVSMSFSHQPSASYARNHLIDQYDDTEEIARVAPSAFNNDVYHATAQPSIDYSAAYRMSQYGERSLLNGNVYNSRNANPNPPAFLNQRHQAQTIHEVDPRFVMNLPYPHVNGGYYSYHHPNGAAIHGIPVYPPHLHHQMAIGAMPSAPPPRGPRELDPGHSLRSALLEDFKTNNKTRRYELKVRSHDTCMPHAPCLQDLGYL